MADNSDLSQYRPKNNNEHADSAGSPNGQYGGYNGQSDQNRAGNGNSNGRNGQNGTSSHNNTNKNNAGTQNKNGQNKNGQNSQNKNGQNSQNKNSQNSQQRNNQQRNNQNKNGQQNGQNKNGQSNLSKASDPSFAGSDKDLGIDKQNGQNGQNPNSNNKNKDKNKDKKKDKKKDKDKDKKKDKDKDKDKKKDKDKDGSGSDDKDKDKDSDDKDKDSDGKDSDKDKDDQDKDKDGQDKDKDDKDKDKDDKDKDKDKDKKGNPFTDQFKKLQEKTAGGPLGKLKSLIDKLKPGKKLKFGDALEQAADKLDDDANNSNNPLKKLGKIPAKIFRLIRKLIMFIKLYLLTLKIYLAYKIYMAVRAFLRWLVQFLSAAWQVITTIVNVAVAVAVTATAPFWGLLIGALAIIATAIALICGLVASIESQNRAWQAQQEYINECENKSPGGDPADSTTQQSVGKNGSRKPLNIKVKHPNTSNYMQAAREVAQAVGKKIGANPKFIFAQIWAEEGPLTGAVQPVVSQDHNLSGMGVSAATKAGTAHGEGDGIYAHYDNWSDYASDYGSLLLYDFKRTGKSIPKTPNDYLIRLKKMGYMKASLDTYRPNFEAGLKMYSTKTTGSGVTEEGGSVIDNSDTGDKDDKCSTVDDNASKGWGWPFTGMTYKSALANSVLEQRFGNTRGGTTPFHDGWDFGTDHYNNRYVHAIHDGTVVKIDHQGTTQHDMGYYVVVKGNDNMTVIYQEFAFFAPDKGTIKVHEGQHISVGQKIAYLTSKSQGVNHIHIGVTSKNYHTAIANSWTSAEAGGWKNPVKWIHDHYGKSNTSDKGSFGGKGDTKLSKSEQAAKQWIAQRESGGNWDARNPINSAVVGKYQLTRDKFGGKDWHDHHLQSVLADKYVHAKYGSWKAAKAFWLIHKAY